MSRLRISALLVLGLAVAASAAPAQSRSMRGGNVLVGLQGGATVGDFGGVSFFDYSSRWGGTAGVFTGLRTSRNTVVGLEANWTQKGGADTRLDYLGIPLTAGAAVPLADGRGRGRFYTGIEMNVRLGCSPSDGPASGPACDRAKDVEWSWPIGMQFGWRARETGFVGLDVRYSLGISDTFDNSSLYDRTWQFRIMYGWEPGSRR
jgi:hypothetical protein